MDSPPLRGHSVSVKAANGGVFHHRAKILNERGLHARAASRFAKLAEAFDADITVTHRDQTVSGRSVMGLMMLAASTGGVIDITASGPQAKDAVLALAELLVNKFEED